MYIYVCVCVCVFITLIVEVILFPSHLFIAHVILNLIVKLFGSSYNMYLDALCYSISAGQF